MKVPNIICATFLSTRRLWELPTTVFYLKKGPKLKSRDEKKSKGYSYLEVLDIAIWLFFCRKIFGQFRQNLAKSGQKLEKLSQHRGLRFHTNQYDFLKLE